MPKDDQPGLRSERRLARWLRSPARVAGAVAVVVHWMWNTGRRVFVDDVGTHPGWNWIVLVFIGYAALALAVLIPRVIAPRAQRDGQDEQLVRFQLAGIQLAAAVTPLLTGFAALGAGADQWVFSTATVATLVFLVMYARASPL